MRWDVLLIQTLAAGVATAGAAILFGVSRRELPWAGLAGALGWWIWGVILQAGGRPVTAGFVGAAGVTVLAEWLARRRHQPATLYIVPGLIPLVPGADAYRTMMALLGDNLSQGLARAVNLFVLAGALAAGVMAVSTFFRSWHGYGPERRPATPRDPPNQPGT